MKKLLLFLLGISIFSSVSMFGMLELKDVAQYDAKTLSYYGYDELDRLHKLAKEKDEWGLAYLLEDAKKIIEEELSYYQDEGEEEEEEEGRWEDYQEFQPPPRPKTPDIAKIPEKIEDPRERVEWLYREAKKVYPLKEKILDIDGVKNIIVQLPSIDQRDNDYQRQIEEMGVNNAGYTCPAMSMRSAALLTDFFRRGERSYLKRLFDPADAIKFVRELRGKKPIPVVTSCTAKQVENMLKKKWVEPLVFKRNVTVVPSGMVFDPNAKEVLDAVYPGLLKQITEISKALKNAPNDFSHAFILGTLEGELYPALAGADRHWFCVFVVKSGDVFYWFIVESDYELNHFTTEDQLGFGRIRALIENLLDTKDKINYKKSCDEFMKKQRERHSQYF